MDLKYFEKQELNNCLPDVALWRRSVKRRGAKFILKINISVILQEDSSNHFPIPEASEADNVK